MEAILQWGLDLIITIQRVHGPVLDGIFRAITFLGNEEFFLFFFPFLLWCVDFGLGVRLGIFLLLSSYLNAGVKDLFQQPRPFDLDPAVRLTAAEGYGLPSGHSQMAVTMWGSLAAWTRKKWAWGVAVALMVLIGFSRIYLGVHFPTDVLAGWAIGVLLLAAYLASCPRIAKGIAALSLSAQVLLALGVPIALFLIHPVEGTTPAVAALAGAGVGLALTHRYVAYSARGPWWQRVVRFLIGIVVALSLYVGLKAAFPSEGAALYLAFRFLRYGLVGLWVGLGAPWLFRMLRLAPAAEDRA